MIQINKNIKFIKNNKFLKKADSYKNSLIKKKIIPYRIVNLKKKKYTVDDIINNNQIINDISKYNFKKNDRVIFDLGNHYVGKFHLDLISVGSPMDSPLYIKIKFAENIYDLVDMNNVYKGDLSSSWIQEEFIHLDDLPQTLKLKRRYSCRYIEIEILDTSPKWELCMKNPIFISESSAKNDVAPLKTNDNMINKIDKVSIKTLKDCMQDVFEDGPKRDRRLWLGDLRLQSLTNYYTFKNIDLVKRCLYLFAALTTEKGAVSSNIFTNKEYIPDDTFLLDYSLLYVACLHDYYNYTKDIDLIEDLYFVAKKQIELAFDLLNDNYILNISEKWPLFIDWSDEFNKNTCGQAILIYSLDKFIELSDILQIPCEYFKDMLSEIKKHTIELLFDEKEGFFTSGNHNEINSQTQIWMILANVLNKEKNKKLMQDVVTKFYPFNNISTPYLHHYFAEAFFEVGMLKEGIQFIKDYWGVMVELGADTFWEAFKIEDLNYSPYNSIAINSYCHAWSCTPSYLFRKYNIEDI